MTQMMAMPRVQNCTAAHVEHIVQPETAAV